ncbi:MAG: transcriptional repressor [Acidobacteria bacterium]|nr:transcriptional repressor [Acidobacteriota bacterium]MCI0567938.1 transcriptional repressor [Acidobacteriota bacterium]
MNRQSRFSQFLESRNLRSTAGRRVMLQEISALGERHFSAEDLVARFRRRGRAVSRATVYRTLEHLLAGGLVRRLSLGHKHSLYESNLGRRHHEHLICLRCGEVTEFGSGTLERLLDGVCRRRRFVAQRLSIQLFGMCARCAEEGRAKRN